MLIEHQQRFINNSDSWEKFLRLTKLTIFQNAFVYFLKICIWTLQLTTSLFQKWLKVYWKMTVTKLATYMYIYIQKKASHCLLYIHKCIGISLIDQFQKIINKIYWFKNEISIYNCRYIICVDWCRSYFLEQNCSLNVIVGLWFIIIIFLAIVVLKSPTSEKVIYSFFKDMYD